MNAFADGPDVGMKMLVQAKMKNTAAFKSNAKSRFMRAIRRLALLSRFAKKQGKHLDIEKLEISNLTEQGNDDCLELEDQVETELQQDYKLFVSRFINNFSL